MKNTSCDCHDLADPTELSTEGIMAYSVNKVAPGGVTKGTARALAQYCSTHSCSQSSALGKALRVLSAGTSDDSKESLAAVVEILGLAPDARRSEVTDAVNRLFDELGDPGDASGGEGLQEGADSPSLVALAQLHSARKANNGISAADIEYATTLSAEQVQPFFARLRVHPLSEYAKAQLKTTGLGEIEFEKRLLSVRSARKA